MFNPYTKITANDIGQPVIFNLKNNINNQNMNKEPANMMYYKAQNYENDESDNPTEHGIALQIEYRKE